MPNINGEINLADYLDGTELARAVHGLPVPGKVSLVDTVPDCDFCNQEGESTLGPFDFATRLHAGSWASGCELHYRLYRASPGLGVGKAQIWIER
jgi:hypothetical protein